MDAIKAQGKWSDISFPNKRAFLHNPTFLTNGEESPPTILDVTAGGGSIPFEAGRLGFKTIANELNPVAYLILKATCQWPQEYGPKLLEDYQEVSKKFLDNVSQRLASTYPKETIPDCANGNCPHPQRYRCVEDCQQPETCNHTKVGTKDHRNAKPQRYVWAYVWTRTVSCPNCTGLIPLSPNWRLDDSGTGISLECDGQSCDFSIVHDRQTCSDCKRNDPTKPCNTASLHPNGQISKGTTTKAVAACPQPNCGVRTPKGYLSSEAQARRMGRKLYAVIYRDSWSEKKKDGTDKKRPTTFRGFTRVNSEHDNLEFTENETSSPEE